jgi:hypothetical protein
MSIRRNNFFVWMSQVPFAGQGGIKTGRIESQGPSLTKDLQIGFFSESELVIGLPNTGPIIYAGPEFYRDCIEINIENRPVRPKYSS